VSAHTQPSPAATETGEPGRRIRAAIAPWFPGGVDDVLVKLEGFDEVLVEFEASGDLFVEQLDAATATPTAMAAASRNQIRERT
jgi:hypothetical protein